ncbi:hypothetical protein [Phyllobacterium ifriqiyense]|uniref:hypothetical protein n=1 Tax=Phyllobacterium ifriqiyense TaxID=314238 RepID=UPI003397E7ED
MTFLKYVLVAVAMVSSFSAYGGEGSGLVRRIAVIGDGRVIFSVDTHNNVPVCGKSVTGEFDFDGTTTVGKNMLAILIAAANTNKPVSIDGSSKCLTRWQDRETALHVTIVY